MNSFQMRKKNENDPLSHPAKFRKPGVVPQPTSLAGLRKRILKQDWNRKSEITRIEKRIVTHALSQSGFPSPPRDDNLLPSEAM